jgi:hypothetical protein
MTRYSYTLTPAGILDGFVGWKGDSCKALLRIRDDSKKSKIQLKNLL